MDDHTVDDNGNMASLVKYARTGIDPEVDKGAPRRRLVSRPLSEPRVLERTSDGLVVLRTLDEPASALPA